MGTKHSTAGTLQSSDIISLAIISHQAHDQARGYDVTSSNVG